MKKVILALYVSIFSFFLFFLPHLAFAAEPSYSVKPIFPEDQLTKDVNFFDLRVVPGEKKVIEIEINNNAEEDLIVDISANTATTSSSGALDYVPATDDVTLSKTLLTPFSTFAQVQKEVKIPPKTSQTVPITMMIPPDEFNGIILGGIRFIDKDIDDEDEAKEAKGMAIRNKFAYIIPVRLSENDNPIEPKIELLDVKPTQFIRRNVFNIELQNPQPMLMKAAEVKATITAKGSKEILYQMGNSDVDFAPNTLFNCPIYLENKPFKAGSYTANVVVKKGDNEWKFTKDFEVEEKQAKAYNDNSSDSLEKTPNWGLYLGIIIGVFIIVIITIVWIGHNKNKKLKQMARQNKKNSSAKNRKKKTSKSTKSDER